jgi:4-aminobutyrate aminotransferase
MGSHRELLERHRALLPSWLATYYAEPIEIVGGRGCTVIDAEGREYLDFFAGILTTMTGHGVPEVVQAIHDQAERLLHSSTLYLSRPMVELAERIAGLSGIENAKVFFTTSGSEANEAALLLATHWRRSNQVLALRNSYHGRSFAAMGVTGNRSWSASTLSPLRVSFLHGGYRFRSPFRRLDDAAYAEACIEDLRDVIATATSGNIACLIAEPIQGVGGFTAPPDGLLGAMKSVLDEHGALFISDEVQTGWGRTGDHFWGYQAHGLVPHLLTFAKGLGNGLPIAGVVARREIMDGLGANSISTFGGNPLVCAGALANLEHLLARDLQGNARRVGGHLMSRLREGAEKLDVVGDLRGKGLMIGIELVGADGYTPDPNAASRVHEQCREQGLLVGKGGLFGNCLRVAPPLCVTREEADRAADTLLAALSQVDGQR